MKQFFIMAVAISSLMLAPPAFAEFRVGAMVGSSSVTGDETDDSLLTGGTERGGSFGVFGQWWHEANNTMDIGIHLGYTSESAGSKEDLGAFATLTDSFSDVTLEVDVDETTDLMGVVAWKGGTVRPFMMAGYSTLKAEATVKGTAARGGTIPAGAFSETEGDTASGWKIAIGAEFPINTNWVGHILIDYADYGKINISDETLELETQSTGIRFGIGYEF